MKEYESASFEHVEEPVDHSLAQQQSESAEQMSQHLYGSPEQTKSTLSTLNNKLIREQEALIDIAPEHLTEEDHERLTDLSETIPAIDELESQTKKSTNTSEDVQDLDTIA